MIWALTPNSNRYLCINPADLRFFWDRFDGRLLSEGWETPEYTLLNKSKKVVDFTSWQITKTLLMTERAKREISNLCGRDVEFLQFGTVKNKLLFALNVLRVEDILDVGRSDFMAGSGLVMRAAFKNVRHEKLPPLFKISPAGISDIYVSEAFGEMLVATKLSGAILRDPAKNPFQQIINREELNDFPGLEGSVRLAS